MYYYIFLVSGNAMSPFIYLLFLFAMCCLLSVSFPVASQTKGGYLFLWSSLTFKLSLSMRMPHTLSLSLSHNMKLIRLPRAPISSRRRRRRYFLYKTMCSECVPVLFGSCFRNTQPRRWWLAYVNGSSVSRVSQKKKRKKHPKQENKNSS